jgi:hypothetical protein
VRRTSEAYHARSLHAAFTLALFAVGDGTFLATASRGTRRFAALVCSLTDRAVAIDTGRHTAMKTLQSFVIGLLLAGCGARVDSGAAADAAGPAKQPGYVADGGASDTSAVPPSGMGETSIDEPPPDPLDASSPPPTDPPPATDCLADDLPPFTHKPLSLTYTREVGPCPSSYCSDFIEFDAYSCVMKLQTKSTSYSAMLPPADCNAFIRWLGSDVLVSHLRDMSTCYGKDVPGAYESTELQLSDGWASKKTASCAEEPFVSHRACIAKLRNKYFPGK